MNIQEVGSDKPDLEKDIDLNSNPNKKNVKPADRQPRKTYGGSN